jgi:hypothetical protein
MLADALEEDADADTRSLLYVAATRARDALVITRAQRYSETQSSAPLPAAVILEASPIYTDAAWLPDVAPSGVVEAALAAPEREIESDAEDGDSETDATASAALESAPPERGVEREAERARPIYPYYALETYTACPRRYRYRELYHLRDGTGPAVGAFHRFVRAGLAEQRRLRAERPDATREEARRELGALWDAQPGVRGTHGALYRAYALDILDAEWDRIPDGAEPRRLALTVALGACAVQLNVDALITRAPDGADEVILERWHTGRPSDTHKGDVRLPLMLMGYEQLDPLARIVSVRLVYVGAPLGEVSASSSAELREAARRRQVEDVTQKTREHASEYRDGMSKQYKQLFNLDRAARSIAAGHFAPKPSSHCATCPYTYICPGDLPE